MNTARRHKTTISENNMRTILVVAYAISPSRGSEYSVGWNYITHMSKKNKIIVLYGCAGEHMGHFSDLDDQFEPGQQNIQFIRVEPSFWARVANIPNTSGVFKYSFYLAYRIWQKQVLTVAKGVLAEQKVDVIHQLSPIGFREPGYLWQLDVPFVIGPIGGIDPRPVKLIDQSDRINRISSHIKNLLSAIQFKYSKRVRLALSSASAVLAATEHGKKKLLEIHHVSAKLLQENAICGDHSGLESDTFYRKGMVLEIVWAGTLDRRKSLDILLSALVQVPYNNWHLSIIGNGHLLDKHMEFCKMSFADGRISFLGKLPRDDVMSHFRRSHLHVITSLAEGNPTVLWEAMSAGIPTLTLDHCGMSGVVCNDCGIKVPVTNRNQVQADIAAQLMAMLTSDSLLRRLQAGVIACRNKYSYHELASDFDDIFDRVTRQG